MRRQLLMLTCVSCLLVLTVGCSLTIDPEKAANSQFANPVPSQDVQGKGGVRDEMPTETIALAGTAWIAVTLNGEPTDDAQPITLQFEADQVSGNATCNRFFGPYVVDDSQITIGPLGTTRRACRSPQEPAFLEAIASVQSFEFANDQLSLLNGDGDVVLVFEKE
ncbi:MAG: META domain-containing protein [Chloroflexota bacterium]